MGADEANLAAELVRFNESYQKQTGAIGKLTEAILAEAHERERKVTVLTRMIYVMVAALVAIIIGVGGVGVIIHQQNNDAAERSKVATEQRETQLEILKRLDAQTK